MHWTGVTLHEKLHSLMRAAAVTDDAVSGAGVRASKPSALGKRVRGSSCAVEAENASLRKALAGTQRRLAATEATLDEFDYRLALMGKALLARKMSTTLVFRLMNAERGRTCRGFPSDWTFEHDFPAIGESGEIEGYTPSTPEVRQANGEPDV